MISRTGKTPADIGVVQQILGHARVSTTAKYAQVMGEDLKGVYEMTNQRAKSKETLVSRPFVRTKYKRV